MNFLTLSSVPMLVSYWFYCRNGRTELVCYGFYSRTELVCYRFYNQTQLVVYSNHKHYLRPNSDTHAVNFVIVNVILFLWKKMTNLKYNY